MTFQVGLSGSGYPDDASAKRFFRRLLEKVEAIPGVESAGAVSHLPLDDYPNWYDYYWREGAPESEHTARMADHRAILPGYFRSAGIALLAGRDVSPNDGPDQPNVIVVDESLARRTWPGQSAIGKRLEVVFIHEGSFDPTVAEVVGVVRHVRDRSLAEDGREQVYVPYAQSAREKLAFTVRASSSGRIRRRSRDRARSGGVARPRPRRREGAHPRLVRRRPRGRNAFHGRSRRRARGCGAPARVRRHLRSRRVLRRGTDRRDRNPHRARAEARVRIVWLVVGETLRTTAAGLAAGLAAALALTGLVARMLYGVGPRDPATLAVSAAVLAAAALLASLLPAGRAMRVDPTIALRHDA